MIPESGLAARANMSCCHRSRPAQNISDAVSSPAQFRRGGAQKAAEKYSCSRVGESFDLRPESDPGGPVGLVVRRKSFILNRVYGWQVAIVRNLKDFFNSIRHTTTFKCFLC